MIVDVHSHFWNYPAHFDDSFRAQAAKARSGVEVDLTVRFEEYQATTPPDTKTIVFGGKAKRSGLWVDDQSVAEYVGQHADQLIGFLSVDPTQPNWMDELHHGHQTLGLRGVKLLPMYAGFSPDSELLEPFWQYTSRHRLPVLLHTGTTFISQAPIEFTLPRLLDRVAMRYPTQRMILAHLGHPYEGECVAIIRKHPHVYADVSALHYRPFQLYQSLMLVQEYGVWDKVLFGTDYPFTTVNDSIAGIRGLNNMLEGTALPRLKESRIEEMICRDSLPLLNLE